MIPSINFFGLFQIQTYLLVISAAYCIGILWVFKRAEKRELNRAVALDLSLIIMVAGFIGARLFHVAYEMPTYYLQNPVAIFQYWRGGFVFFGGAITAFITCLLYLKKSGRSFYEWADVFTPAISLGYAIGRVGCFMAGCCYGSHCDLPWAIVFPEGSDAPAGMPLHPTQLYAVVWELYVLYFILWVEHKLAGGAVRPPWLKFYKPKGNLFLAWIFFHSVGRLIMEFFREDDRGPALLGLSISSVISCSLIILSLAFFIKNLRSSDTRVTNSVL